MKSLSQNFQVFVQSHDLQIPIFALNVEKPNLNYTLQHLKSSVFPTSSIPQSSFLFFTLNGKPILNSTYISRSSAIANLSTLTLHVHLRGGGGDGSATGVESRDCYLHMYAMKKPDKVDQNEIHFSKWLNCSLSNEPLRWPMVIDKLGNLFNKEALVEAFLEKKLPREFGYIRGLKDMILVELAEIPGKGKNGAVKFQCPIAGVEFNGKYKFHAIKSCGHVLSAKGFKIVKSSACLICHKEFAESDEIVINGNGEELKELWKKLMEEKAKVKDNVKKVMKARNGDLNREEVGVGQWTGRKHGIEAGSANGSTKKFKAIDIAPSNATKEVYASIFTSSKKLDFKETYSCRSCHLVGTSLSDLNICVVCLTIVFSIHR